MHGRRRSGYSSSSAVLAIAGAIALCSSAALARAQDAPETERTGKRWIDMDYGPFLTTSVQCRPKSNIAYKGIGIPLGGLPDGESASMVFDTDTLRWAAGWTGGFLQLNGVVFDGVHGTFPAIAGDQHWGTMNEPGWAAGGGSFDEPRDYQWGPLPRNHAHWKGLYLNGDDVVLSYQVGDAAVLEIASVSSHDGMVVFVRTLEVGPTSRSLAMQVAADDGGTVTLYDTRPETNRIESNEAAMAISLLGVAGDSGPGEFVGAAYVGPIDGTAWDTGTDGRIRLRIPASEETRVFRVLVARGLGDEDVQRLIDAQDDIADLRQPSKLIDGGPRRWRQTILTQGELDIESSATERTIMFAPRGGTSVFPPGSEVSAYVDDRLINDWKELSASGAVVLTAQTRAFPGLDPESLDRGLLGWWTFDEGQGDSSANQIEGGGPVQFEGATWRRGLRDRSVEFNGTTSARLPLLDEFEFADGSLTFAAWLNTEADGTIFSHTLPDSQWVPNGKTFFVRQGRLCFDMGWVGVVESPVVVADGLWHHVAFTWSNTTRRVSLFVDGAQVAVGTLEPEDRVNGHIARLAYTSPNFPQGGMRLSGKLDELRLYDRVLPAEELLYLATIPEKMPVRAYAALDAPIGARWVVVGDTSLGLRVPPSDHETVVRCLLWDGTIDELSTFTSLVAARHSGPREPFAIDRISWPEDNPWSSWMRFGGFDFFTSDQGRAAICTWSGDVWTIDGLDSDLMGLRWQRIATGLYQPLGLKIVDDVVYVAARDQITRLHDLNGDGEIDFYENFNNDTLNTDHFHEPAMDLQTDSKGNFYYMKGGRHALRAQHPHHGNLIRVSADGSTTEIIGGGFRASNGLGIGPRDEVYGTDQEGYWMPANKITRVEPGQFHGNGWGWLPDGIPDTFVQPLCWLHPSIDRSPSEPFWVEAGQWGLREGRLFGLSYGTGHVYQVLSEERDGVLQGGITPTGVRLPTGAMRARVNPGDGQVYVCGLVGWSSDRPDPGGFYRVRRTGSPLHIPQEVRATATGLDVTFPHALDASTAADPSNYRVQAWNYKWTEAYGSPQFRFDGTEGKETLGVLAASLSDDGLTVCLVLERWQPVMQYHLEISIEAADGTPIDTYIHGTAHQVSRAAE